MSDHLKVARPLWGGNMLVREETVVKVGKVVTVAIEVIVLTVSDISDSINSK